MGGDFFRDENLVFWTPSHRPIEKIIIIFSSLDGDKTCKSLVVQWRARALVAFDTALVATCTAPSGAVSAAAIVSAYFVVIDVWALLL